MFLIKDFGYTITTRQSLPFASCNIDSCGTSFRITCGVGDPQDIQDLVQFIVDLNVFLYTNSFSKGIPKLTLPIKSFNDFDVEYPVELIRYNDESVFFGELNKGKEPQLYKAMANKAANSSFRRLWRIK